jgi:hypothetical protein
MSFFESERYATLNYDALNKAAGCIQGTAITVDAEILRGRKHALRDVWELKL